MIVVLLTRPYDQSVLYITPSNYWRKYIPEYNRKVIEVSKKNNNLVIDLAKIFKEKYPNEFIDEGHFTVQGHILAAGIIFNYLRANKLLCKE